MITIFKSKKKREKIRKRRRRNLILKLVVIAAVASVVIGATEAVVTADAEYILLNVQNSVNTNKVTIYSKISSLPETSAEVPTISNSDVTISASRVYPSENYIDVNMTIYNIAAEYANKEYVGNEQWDPLFLLALSIAEFGGATNYTKTTCPAVPSAYMDTVTVQDVKQFGIKDYVGKGTYKFLETKHQGPLQLNINFGIYSDDILTKLSPNTEVVLVGNSGYLNGSQLGKLRQKPGDRFNWPDSCLIGGAYGKYIFKNISKNYNESFNNPYGALAAFAVAHNTGEGWTTLPGYARSESSIDSTNPWTNYTLLYEWLKGFDTENAQKYFEEKALQLVLANKDRPITPHAIDAREASQVILPEMIQKGILTQPPIGSKINLMGNDYEKVSYPIQVCYYYAMLKCIYGGY